MPRLFQMANTANRKAGFLLCSYLIYLRCVIWSRRTRCWRRSCSCYRTALRLSPTSSPCSRCTSARWSLSSTACRRARSTWKQISSVFTRRLRRTNTSETLCRAWAIAFNHLHSTEWGRAEGLLFYNEVHSQTINYTEKEDTNMQIEHLNGHALPPPFLNASISLHVLHIAGFTDNRRITVWWQ